MTTILRRTAVFSLAFGDAGPAVGRALDASRRYRFDLVVDGHEVATGEFQSPLGDQSWNDFIRQLRSATSADNLRVPELRAAREAVEAAGARLLEAVCAACPPLASFLREDVPRRLVIRSSCPEIHRLPWEALHDRGGVPWTYLGATNLSIVHADSFDIELYSCVPPGTVRLVFGPNVPRQTGESIEQLRTKAQNLGEKRLEFREAPGAGGPTIDWDGDIVHVEAHGEAATGVVDTGSVTQFETELADRIGSRWLVLLWSCHSALVQSWGESVAMRLHRGGNRLVLAFATPLRFVTSGRLAKLFYSAVFECPNSTDPETAIGAMRKWLYDDQRPACEWATLTVWMRQPLNVERLALNGPRILVGEELAEGPDEKLTVVFEKAIRRDARPGAPLVVSGWPAGKAPSASVFAQFPGAVVQLRSGGDSPLQGHDRAISELKIAAPPSAHRADAILTILDHLTRLRGSLFLWSDVGRRELATWAASGDGVPGLAVVLASPWTVPNFPGFAPTELAKTVPEPYPPGPACPVEAIEAASRAGRHGDAAGLWTVHVGTLVGRTADERVRFHLAGYQAFARLGNALKMKACVEAVRADDPVEASLLEGNRVHRDGSRALARSHYEAAAAAAERADRPLDRGRALLEIAYLASEEATPVADAVFREARALLEGIRDRTSDERWASALGRGLRDHADLLARDGQRLDEARDLARRALWIHGLDGRVLQIAATLRTRAAIERAGGRADRAESALLAAARVQHEHGNYGGWLGVIADLCDLALEHGRFGQVETIADAVFKRCPAKRNLRGRDAARIAGSAATAAWREGRPADTETWVHRRIEADGVSASVSDLRDMLAVLTVGWPDVVAFAGRRVDAEDATPRFPVDRVDVVRTEVRAALLRLGAKTVVGSAACGADLIVLEEASRLGLHARVVLPCNPDLFRATSVSDRPGPWKDIFQSVIDSARASNDLVVPPAAAVDHAAYLRTNETILTEAVEIAGGNVARRALGVVALVVWDGKPRGEDDVTAAFAARAREFGLPVVEISTVGP